MVLKYSKDGGSTWLPTAGGRRAIDIAPRQVEPDGLGYFFWAGRTQGDVSAHPQLMPAVACGGGQCMVTYWESRQAGVTTTTGRISGYTRLMDLRGALLDATGQVTRSFQISRYPYRPETILATDANGVKKVVAADGTLRDEDINDVERVNDSRARVHRRRRDRAARPRRRQRLHPDASISTPGRSRAAAPPRSSATTTR